MMDNLFIDIMTGIATVLFCGLLSVFLVPLIVERIFIYTPQLIKLSMKHEIEKRGLFFNIISIVAWMFIVSFIYLACYLWDHSLLTQISISVPALMCWMFGLIAIVYRLARFKTVVQKEFYRDTYLRYVTPESLARFDSFIVDTETMYTPQLKKLLDEKLPYHYRYVVNRRIDELKRNPMMFTPDFSG